MGCTICPYIDGSSTTTFYVIDSNFATTVSIGCTITNSGTNKTTNPFEHGTIDCTISDDIDGITTKLLGY